MAERRFGAGDTIDLAGILLTSADLLNDYNSTSGDLTVAEGGSSYVLHLDHFADYAGDLFSAFDDGRGDTEISVTCFCTGTRIATPDGHASVENLRVGDLVRLHDGRAVPVRWVGVQTVSRQFADPVRVLPVRIAAGALGGQLPRRDLMVSPGHALLMHGVLVQAGALVGLPGISRATDMPKIFAYWHIELDEHALLLAEGVAAESYLPAAEGAAFDNRATRPGRTEAVEMAWPRVKAARQFPAALRGRRAA
jgi:hypothetical protein